MFSVRSQKSLLTVLQAVCKRIGHRSKVRRVELELQQKELGALLGVPQSHISESEIGRRALRVEQAMEIAEALQTTVGYFVGETERRD